MGHASSHAGADADPLVDILSASAAPDTKINGFSIHDKFRMRNVMPHLCEHVNHSLRILLLIRYLLLVPYQEQ